MTKGAETSVSWLYKGCIRIDFVQVSLEHFCQSTSPSIHLQLVNHIGHFALLLLLSSDYNETKSAHIFVQRHFDLLLS